LQAEFNQELLEPLHDLELNEWNEHGKVRQKWEKYLRGPEPKRRKGHKWKFCKTGNALSTKSL
jgi:hypothetical protein